MPNYSYAIDQEIGRDAVYRISILDLFEVIFRQEHRCGRRFFLEVKRNLIILFVDADLNDDRVFSFVFVLNLLKVRILRTARPSPRLPEIEQYDFALVVGQLHFLAADSRKFKRGRGLALKGHGRILVCGH